VGNHQEQKSALGLFSDYFLVGYFACLRSEFLMMGNCGGHEKLSHTPVNMRNKLTHRSVIMNTTVVNALTEYFGASADQVEAYDEKVVNTLASDMATFREFLSGCERTKWTIYVHAKFGRGNAPDLRPVA
jgi:hypothetical protein